MRCLLPLALLFVCAVSVTPAEYDPDAGWVQQPTPEQTPGVLGWITQPPPCQPQTIYRAEYKTEVQKVPHLCTSNLDYKAAVTPSTLYITEYVSYTITESVPHHQTKYVTETKVQHKYVTKTKHHTKYITKTAKYPAHKEGCKSKVEIVTKVVEIPKGHKKKYSFQVRY